jgi:hypothetical protein
MSPWVAIADTERHCGMHNGRRLKPWVLAGAGEKAVTEALRNATATCFAEHQAICPVCNRIGK